MAVGFPSLAGQPTTSVPKPLDTAPILIIENPLESYYKLNTSQLELGIKFSKSRLKHVETIDAIFTDENQVSLSLFYPFPLSISLFCSNTVIILHLHTRATSRAPLTGHTITYHVMSMKSIYRRFD